MKAKNNILYGNIPTSKKPEWFTSYFQDNVEMRVDEIIKSPVKLQIETARIIRNKVEDILKKLNISEDERKTISKFTPEEKATLNLWLFFSHTSFGRDIHEIISSIKTEKNKQVYWKKTRKMKWDRERIPTDRIITKTSVPADRWQHTSIKRK